MQISTVIGKRTCTLHVNISISYIHASGDRKRMRERVIYMQALCLEMECRIRLDVLWPLCMEIIYLSLSVERDGMHIYMRIHVRASRLLWRPDAGHFSAQEEGRERELRVRRMKIFVVRQVSRDAQGRVGEEDFRQSGVVVSQRATEFKSSVLASFSTSMF